MKKNYTCLIRKKCKKEKNVKIPSGYHLFYLIFLLVRRYDPLIRRLDSLGYDLSTFIRLVELEVLLIQNSFSTYNNYGVWAEKGKYYTWKEAVFPFYL